MCFQFNNISDNALIKATNANYFIGFKNFNTPDDMSVLYAFYADYKYEFTIHKYGLITNVNNTLQIHNMHFNTVNYNNKGVKAISDTIIGVKKFELGYHMNMYNTNLSIVKRHKTYYRPDDNSLCFSLPCGVYSYDIQLVSDDEIICDRFMLLNPLLIEHLFSKAIYKQYSTLYNNIYNSIKNKDNVCA